MYRIITYKSKPLKKTTIILEEDYSSSDFNESKKKKKRKKDDDVKTYMIDGVEVREEDLTPDERMDIESASILNQDGFYTPLQPLDIYVQETIEERKSGNTMKIIFVIAGMFVALGGIVAVMIMIL